MELTPNFAGTLMGMTTMVANTTGFLAPLFTGAVTNNNVRFRNEGFPSKLLFRLNFASTDFPCHLREVKLLKNYNLLIPKTTILDLFKPYFINNSLTVCAHFAVRG